MNDPLRSGAIFDPAIVSVIRSPAARIREAKQQALASPSRQHANFSMEQSNNNNSSNRINEDINMLIRERFEAVYRSTPIPKALQHQVQQKFGSPFQQQQPLLGSLSMSRTMDMSPPMSRQRISAITPNKYADNVPTYDPQPMLRGIEKPIATSGLSSIIANVQDAARGASLHRTQSSSSHREQERDVQEIDNSQLTDENFYETQFDDSQVIPKQTTSDKKSNAKQRVPKAPLDSLLSLFSTAVPKPNPSKSLANGRTSKQAITANRRSLSSSPKRSTVITSSSEEELEEEESRPEPQGLAQKRSRGRGKATDEEEEESGPELRREKSKKRLYNNRMKVDDDPDFEQIKPSGDEEDEPELHGVKSKKRAYNNRRKVDDDIQDFEQIKPKRGRKPNPTNPTNPTNRAKHVAATAAATKPLTTSTTTPAATTTTASSKEWTQEESTKLYIAHTTTDYNTPNFWGVIAEKLRTQGVSRTQEECENRWYQKMMKDTLNRRKQREQQQQQQQQQQPQQAIKSKPGAINDQNRGEIVLPDVSKRPKRITKKDLRALAQTALNSAKPDDLFDSSYFKKPTNKPTHHNNKHLEAHEDHVEDSDDDEGERSEEDIVLKSATKRKIQSYVSNLKLDKFQLNSDGDEESAQSDNSESEHSDSDLDEGRGNSHQPFNNQLRHTNPSQVYIQKLGRNIGAGDLLRQTDNNNNKKKKNSSVKSSNQQKSTGNAKSKSLQRELEQIKAAEEEQSEDDDEILPSFLTKPAVDHQLVLPYEGEIDDEEEESILEIDEFQ